ncbi:hypothetical protein K435DRAFT_871665 [Dendrothele bispora CBS 962.96]|uniref:DUF6534 domain-containing protein n=1 Tax=Dendrothele bispora (strain CBS 962.96) TaxID=1314807 RepID=A0A4S8L3X8_DENBC|nr:hypothetical protein K435DRAFT_871665 [Dendrothele bispora CBS 962.96]
MSQGDSYSVSNIEGIIHPELTTIGTMTFKVTFALNASLAALCDVIATAALLLPLRTVSKTIGLTRTENMIQKLLQYIITRGILVTALQICMMTIFLAVPDELLCASKLKQSLCHNNDRNVNVILWGKAKSNHLNRLNSRSHLRNAGIQPETLLSTLRFGDNNPTNRMDPETGYVLAIKSDSPEVTVDHGTQDTFRNIGGGVHIMHHQMEAHI